MTLGDWITAVVAVLAFLLSILALLFSRRAAVASERSADSSQQSANAAQRSADVAERQERRELRDAEERAVRWTVNRLGSAIVRLTNIGEGTAYDVTVRPSPGAEVAGVPRVDGAAIQPGLSVRGGYQSPVSGSVTLGWRSHGAGRPAAPARR